MEFEHTSVLLKETIENLRIKPDGVYVDGTLGGGGHSYEIASALGDKGRLFGIDVFFISIYVPFPLPQICYNYIKSPCQYLLICSFVRESANSFFNCKK